MGSSNISVVSPGILLRSSRPGYPSKCVDVSEVQSWIEDVRKQGVRTILCLLDDQQLGFYDQLGEKGLIERYQDAGFHVINHSIPDHSFPPVPAETLDHIAYDFLAAELPVLVHCSAGIDRTGAVVDHLTRNRMFEIREKVEELMEENSGQRGVEHFRHVSFLALRLYDALGPVHNLTQKHRAVLWMAAMLHDIGTPYETSQLGHPWISGMQILAAKDLLECDMGLIDSREVATVAALHGIDEVTDRDPLGDVHGIIADLWPDDGIPRDLQMLAAILRVADGLDRNLSQTVKDVAVEGSKIIVVGKGKRTNIERARQKSGLLCHLMDMEWEFHSVETGNTA